jgi:hypothetical protein
MKNIKIKNGYYVNDFSSISEEHTWGSLKNFIKKNSEYFSSISFDEKERRATVSFLNQDDIIDIIKDVDKSKILEKTLVRTIKLNTKFNKETCMLALSDENIEKFRDYNEVQYEITCRKTNNDSSLFFHESALIDYTKNISNLDQCNTVLALITFDQNESVFNIKNDKISNRIVKQSIFLCLNVKEDKFIENSFLDYNKTKLNIDKFIENYNKGINFNKGDYITVEQTAENISTYSFSNFQISVSEFLLPNADIVEFLNFKSFVGSFIYDNFIKSLYNSLEKIWPLEGN